MTNFNFFFNFYSVFGAIEGLCLEGWEINKCYFVVQNWWCELSAISGFRVAAAGHLAPGLLGFSLLATFRSMTNLLMLKRIYVFSFMYYFVIVAMKNHYSFNVCINSVFFLYADSF